MNKSLKILIMVLVLSLAFILTACGGGGTTINVTVHDFGTGNNQCQEYRRC